MKSSPDEKALFEQANAQQGLFTAKQAAACGYSSKNHHYYVKSGQWIREGWGIYRLARYPTTERPDLMFWYLWSRNRNDTPQGVYSHSTALSLYDLSDIMPAKYDMTVPTGFRVSKEVPECLQLYKRELPEEDIRYFQGVQITTPLRTLIDVIEEDKLSRDLIQNAIADALETGLIASAQQMRDHSHVKARARLLKKIDGYIESVRP